MSNKKKWTYYALLIMGGVALLVDRLLLSDSVTTPQAAVAAPVRTASAGPAAPAAVEPKTLSIPELPFPHNLKPLDASYFAGPIRDLFAPPQPPEGSEAGMASAGHPDPDVDPKTGRPRLRALTFQANYRVNGVLLRSGLKIAIMNGTWMRVGETVDGCTLLKVGDNEVRFGCYDGPARLQVNGGRGPPTRGIRQGGN